MGVSAAAGTLLGPSKALSAAATRPVVFPAKPHFQPVTPVDPRKTLALVYDQDYLLYEGPRVGTFFESPSRLQAIATRLTDMGFNVVTHPVAEATVEQLGRAHTYSYIRYIQKAKFLPQDEFVFLRHVEKRFVNRPSPTASGPSALTPKFQSVIRYVKAPVDAPRVSKLPPYRAAALAAGGAVRAVDQVMTGKAQTSFALIRPPGHHAMRARNMGFCVFNNAAVAARHAQKTHGAKRVMIIDWDVHHGNGTQEIFYTDPSVLYFSTHQENIYPKRTGKVTETGAGAGRGFNVNVPLPPRTGDDGFLQVFREVLTPVARAFKPDLIIVSAGQDAHLQDFVAQMRVSDAGFAQMTRVVKQLSAELCDSKLVFVLEGGYNPKVASRAVETIVRVLQAEAGADDFLGESYANDMSPAFRARLSQVKQTHVAHWPSLGRA